MVAFIRGNKLSQKDRRYALAAYVHRYTLEHIPAWVLSARRRGEQPVVQFASDADWLANTGFAVTNGGFLDKRHKSCYSYPTWPHGSPSASGKNHGKGH